MIATIRQSMALGLLLLVSNAHADGVPADCTQLIVAVGPNWDSMHGQMQLFERKAPGGKWTKSGSPFPVLFGKTGAAWGSGLAGQNESGPHKKNAMVALRREYFASVKFIRTIRIYPPARIIRFIR